MQILINTSNNYQPTSAFTSRNPKIKALDKICRNVSNEFPVYSSTRMDGFTTVHKHPHAYNILGYLDDIISDLRGFIKTIPDKKQGLIAELKSVKELHAGNCHELANAGYVACRMNGYKNAVPMHVYAYNTKTKTFRTLDHVAVGINFTKELKNKPEEILPKVFCDDRDAIILDPWCGFTDYANNASVKYRSHKTFGKTLLPEEKICYIPLDRKDLSRKDILFFRHTYPNISKKKKFNLIDRIIWYFTDKKQYETEDFPISIRECHRTNHKLAGALTPAEITKMYQIQGETQRREFIKEVRKK